MEDRALINVLGASDPWAGFSPVVYASMAFVLILIAGITVACWRWERLGQEKRKQKDREKTYREIAAYVAEGTITPADAERMIKAMGSVDEADRTRRELDQMGMRG
jgi:hypothetical protein